MNKGDGKLPIRRRQKSSTDIYHVIVKGINKELIFNQQREKIYFKSIILKYLKKYQIEIYCYCIMSNHAHFIIRADLPILSLFMANVLSEYALYYNFKHHRNGHVFQNRFRSECIEDERYFWACLRYIHMNPVKAKMVKSSERYKYSSMKEYMLEKAELLHENAYIILKNHFKDKVSFKEFHRGKPEEVFIDTADDEQNQQEEVALCIAQELAEEKRLVLLNQVFEEKSIRKEYIERLRKKLGLSQKKAKELFVLTMWHVENIN